MSSLYCSPHFVLMFLAVFIDWSVSFPYNLYLTEWTDKNENDLVFQHDCLYVNHWENGDENIQEITPYCFSEWPSKWIIHENTREEKYTFAQLFARNITSEQLYLWSTPVDIVENYQSYLDQVLTLNGTSLAETEFFNCTGIWFGSMCQYSFDLEKSSSSSLKEIVFEFYLQDREKQLGQSCYTHSECDLGFSSLCIQWYEICDGVVRCRNGADEEHCWQLEINECSENEFRCQNGQCIPSSFLADNKKTYDCLDGSDEFNEHETYDIRDRAGPVYKLEGMFCSENYLYKRTYLIECRYECFDYWSSAPNEWLFFVDEPKTFSSECWAALSCYLKIIKLVNNSNCTDICQGDRCKEIIAQKCPKMFFMPNAPVAFGHIYFAYTSAYLINQTEPLSAPEYICYNEQLCGGFGSNKTSISFNNTTCRRGEDLIHRFFNEFDGHSLCSYIGRILFYFPNCNTVPSMNSAICDTSTMYQCINSSKCIPQIRLLDNVIDCDHEDDEQWYSINHHCPIKSSQLYFNCTMSNECISRKQVVDGDCNCAHEIRNMCEDEFFPATHPALHISFPHICNHILQYGPVLIDGKKENDESDCEHWPCHNIYSHCNGILDCSDGIDELDCHPSSLINCSSRSFVCFSYLTADYTCLSATKMNDGNIDCIGGFDEIKPCQKLPLAKNYGRFFCKSPILPECTPKWLLCNNISQCLNNDDERFCHHFENVDIFRDNDIFHNQDTSIHSDKEEFLHNQFKNFEGRKATHFSLGKMPRTNPQSIKHDAKMTSISASRNEIISFDRHYCYSHPSLRVWLNKDENNTTMTCLCPPSHYGDRCQYQKQRVTLTIHFRAFSDSWQTPFIIIVSLIDDSDERIIHSHEQLTYASVPNCQTKYNIELLYVTSSKNQSQFYFVHLDIYEKKQIPSYRGSLRVSLPFLFLPIQRVAVQIDIYIYKEESLFVCLFFMHLKTVRANALKFCTEYPSDQRKVIE